MSFALEIIVDILYEYIIFFLPLNTSQWGNVCWTVLGKDWSEPGTSHSSSRTDQQCEPTTADHPSETSIGHQSEVDCDRQSETGSGCDVHSSRRLESSLDRQSETGSGRGVHSSRHLESSNDRQSETGSGRGVRSGRRLESTIDRQSVSSITESTIPVHGGKQATL